MNDEELINLLDDIKQIENVAEELDYLNFNKMDIPIANFIAEFSKRNKDLIHSIISIIIRNLTNKNNYINENDEEYNIVDVEGIKLLIIFSLRDIIENLEVLSWLKLNNYSLIDSIKNNSYTIDNEESFLHFIEKYISYVNGEQYTSYKRKINGQEKMKSYKIDKYSKNSLEVELEKIYGKINLSNDFEYIQEVKKTLHNYIHKNGIKYINIATEYTKFLKEYLNKLKLIFKFYFKINFLLDGTSIASSDYIDYLECGQQPPEGCQYWVAPIFDEYISKQFNEEDKKWLIDNNICNMQFYFN